MIFFSLNFSSNLANIFEYFLDSFHLRRQLMRTDLKFLLKFSIELPESKIPPKSGPKFSSLFNLAVFRRLTMSNRSKALHKLCRGRREFIDFPGLSKSQLFLLTFSYHFGPRPLVSKREMCVIRHWPLPTGSKVQ